MNSWIWTTFGLLGTERRNRASFEREGRANGAVAASAAEEAQGPKDLGGRCRAELAAVYGMWRDESKALVWQRRGPSGHARWPLGPPPISAFHDCGVHHDGRDRSPGRSRLLGKPPAMPCQSPGEG